MSKKYATKQVEIEALQFKRTNWKEIVRFTEGKAYNIMTPRHINGISTCSIETLEGVMEATEGDYIIRGLKGEYYPCKPDIFEMKYEEIKNK